MLAEGLAADRQGQTEKAEVRGSAEAQRTKTTGKVGCWKGRQENLRSLTRHGAQALGRGLRGTLGEPESPLQKEVLSSHVTSHLLQDTDCSFLGCV